MGGLAASTIVDLIILLVAFEAAALFLLRRRLGRGPAYPDIAMNLLAGALLLVALRAALVDTPWIWIAACLAAACCAHIVDQSRRWRT